MAKAPHSSWGNTLHCSGTASQIPGGIRAPASWWRLSLPSLLAGLVPGPTPVSTGWANLSASISSLSREAPPVTALYQLQVSQTWDQDGSYCLWSLLPASEVAEFLPAASWVVSTQLKQTFLSWLEIFKWEAFYLHLGAFISKANPSSLGIISNLNFVSASSHRNVKYCFLHLMGISQFKTQLPFLVIKEDPYWGLNLSIMNADCTDLSLIFSESLSLQTLSPEKSLCNMYKWAFNPSSFFLSILCWQRAWCPMGNTRKQISDSPYKTLWSDIECSSDAKHIDQDKLF